MGSQSGSRSTRSSAVIAWSAAKAPLRVCFCFAACSRKASWSFLYNARGLVLRVEAQGPQDAVLGPVEVAHRE